MPIASPVFPAAPVAPQPPAPEAGNPVLGSLTDTAKSTFSNPTLLKALLASALGSGAIGGVLSAREPGREGESRGQRLKRILRNAAGSAAAGAGAVGAGALGYNLFNKSPDAGGAASAADNLQRSLLGRGTTGAVGGALGNAAAGKYEKAKTLARVVNTPGLSAGGTKLPPGTKPKNFGTSPITEAEINSVFGTPSAKPSLPAMRDQHALVKRLQTLTPGLTEEGAHDIIRTLGHTPPGERDISALAKRHFKFWGGGASRGVMGRPVNLRALGGLTGTALGVAAPNIIDGGRKVVRDLFSSDGEAPANPGFFTRPIL